MLPKSLDAVELFGGCGGLGLGLARAGFRSRAFLEWADNAVATVRYNAQREVEHVRDWPILHSDVRNVKWDSYQGQLALVSGGPPCQPFGIGGLKKGSADSRDMWPEAIRSIRETMPLTFLFENVRNLAGPKFRPYLEWVDQRLRHVGAPSRQGGETPAEQITRLQQTPVTYRTSISVVNAADFGAPQVRYRVLLAGVRADLAIEPGRPKPTHSLFSLLWGQWVTGDYWVRHGLRMPPNDAIPPRLQTIVRRLRSQMVAPTERPWVTLRDAISGLGEPNGENNHVFQPGARVYPGHTGSPLDLPAKALKAGDHGVPGGENMMVLPDGGVRYFTLRESARLVGLPDEYGFCRSWTESMRCLGNAVPVQLGEAAGLWMRGLIEASARTRSPARKRAA